MCMKNISNGHLQCVDFYVKKIGIKNRFHLLCPFPVEKQANFLFYFLVIDTNILDIN